jgi:hypothetical protein
LSDIGSGGRAVSNGCNQRAADDGEVEFVAGFKPISAEGAFCTAGATGKNKGPF